MADRKPFLLRLDPALLEALQRWASDEVRSLNGQIEFLLTRALRDARRLDRDGKKGEGVKDGRRGTGDEGR